MRNRNGRTNKMQSLLAFLRALVGSCKKKQRRNDVKTSLKMENGIMYLQLFFCSGVAVVHDVPLLILENG